MGNSNYTAPKYTPIKFPKGTTEQEAINILNAQPDREFKVKSMGVERGSVNELDLPPISSINPLYAENIYVAIARQATVDLIAGYVGKLTGKKQLQSQVAMINDCEDYFLTTLKSHYARIINHCKHEACVQITHDENCKKCKKRRRCQTKCEKYSNTLLEYITKITSNEFEQDEQLKKR